MERHFESELNELNKYLVEMATLTEEMISRATQAVKEHDFRLGYTRFVQDIFNLLPKGSIF